MPTGTITKPEIAEVPEAKGKTTWEDFTLEEHMKAHVGVPSGCMFWMKSVGPDIYRYNIINKATAAFVKSDVIRVITTPQGYIFEEPEYRNF